jgi:hypothetical protein
MMCRRILDGAKRAAIMSGHSKVPKASHLLEVENVPAEELDAFGCTGFCCKNNTRRNQVAARGVLSQAHVARK